jgi:hypothetical protein
VLGVLHGHTGCYDYCMHFALGLRLCVGALDWYVCKVVCLVSVLAWLHAETSFTLRNFYAEIIFSYVSCLFIHTVLTNVNSTVFGLEVCVRACARARARAVRKQFWKYVRCFQDSVWIYVDGCPA